MYAQHAARPRRDAPDQAATGGYRVGPSRDGHERAADRAADAAMTNAERASGALRPLAGGSPLRGHLGGGDALPARTRDYFEKRLGHDLGGVRIHAGERAAASARGIDAAAYTLGSDIAFGAGRWQPDSAAGQRLLAHELAHVVQQGGGNPSLGLAAAPAFVQRVDTLGGTWSTDSYRLTFDAAGNHEGCEVDRLRFKPNEQVDATRIGLVQAVTSRESGSVTAINPTVDTRSIPAGQTDEGLHIDRMASRRNPVYGMDDPTVANPTLGSSTPASNAEWGHRFRLSFLGMSVPLEQDATLYDGPALPGHGPNSSQIFETTALAVSGAQAGTHYGSVRWGWQSDASNNASLIPLSLVSVGVPTVSFRAASELWNENPTSTGAATLDLPIAAGSTSGKLPREMTTGEIFARLSQIRAEREAAVVGNFLAPFGLGESRTLETLDFEEAALRRELLNRAGDFPLPTGDTQYA
jgi:hypothetical protein